MSVDVAKLQKKIEALDSLADEAIEIVCDYEDEQSEDLRERLSWIREGRLDKYKEG